VRRDRADWFATRPEGVGGRRAVDWRLVDEVVARPAWAEVVGARASEEAARRPRPQGPGCPLPPLAKEQSSDAIHYRHVDVGLDHRAGVARITVKGPAAPPPSDVTGLHDLGADFWSLAATRELDDLILDLRTNAPQIGTWVIRTEGDAQGVLAHDRLLLDHRDDWLAREILLYLGRTLKRLDVSPHSLIALVEPGSCFAGSLLELALAADRTYHLDGPLEDGGDDPPATVVGDANLGPLPMGNGLTRLQSRLSGDADAVARAAARAGEPVGAAEAVDLGLATFSPDDLDWEDEVRIAVEERASFSPDALTGLEANLRFVGPETLETKIFGRLSAWQNWIFTRPNAAGPDGALRSYGTGRRPDYDRKRA